MTDPYEGPQTPDDSDIEAHRYTHRSRVEERIRWYLNEFGKDQFHKIAKWILERGDYPQLTDSTKVDKIGDIAEILLEDQNRQTGFAQLLDLPKEEFFQYEQIPRAQFLDMVYEYQRGQVPKDV